MTDILIRGMEMPVSCFGCPLIALQNDGGTHCKLTCTSCEIGRVNDDCPLHELPEHGDLIDRDALEYDEAYLNGHYERGDVEIIEKSTVDEAPVIIPSNKETKNAN